MRLLDKSQLLRRLPTQKRPGLLHLAGLVLLLAACASVPACRQGDQTSSQASGIRQNTRPYKPVPYVQIKHPEWSKNASIYQINTRQFTTEGTFRAAENQLPRLKDLGVAILWLMPIHPIGRLNRKGSLGSPYSVRDYFSVNPEFGTLDDLKHFVDHAHELGMHVILDWVANHTAWDNPIVTRHPDWYKRNWKGDFHPTSWSDWSDIIELDFDNPALREYMTGALRYWVTEADIDGYRCDVAGYVPLDFWNNARRELDLIKPVFMLAEWESRDLHAAAFDLTYAWGWYTAMHELANGKKNVSSLFGYYATNENAYPADSMRMTFVSNHDKNAWEGTQFEQFGQALEAVIALSVIGEGMPLIYNGQEAGNTKRLAFFEKDTIKWQPHAVGKLYKKLLALKKENTALWNGHWGATMTRVPNSAAEQIFSFVRQNDNDKVFAVFNFSATRQSVSFQETLYHGTYTDYFSGQPHKMTELFKLEIEPWSFRVFTR